MSMTQSQMPDFVSTPPSPTPGLMPLSKVALRARAKAGLARIVLEQCFDNSSDEVLCVTYKLPLPAEAAVSGFEFVLGERTVRGVVKAKQQAREDFERAMVEGRSGALLEQERQSLFSQEIGNIPPRTSVVVRVELDAPLSWLDEGSWELRFPLAAAPRYLGSLPSEGDVSIATSLTPSRVRAEFELTIDDELAARRSPESPSHPLQVVARAGGFDVELGAGNQAALDRDIVVRWPVATPNVSLSLDHTACEGHDVAYGLLTIAPPDRAHQPTAVSRELVLLLDTSGSMSGEPLAQEKRIALALVDSLSDSDLIHAVEFSYRTHAFRSAPVAATPNVKRDLSRWISALEAKGGTEMVSGVQASLAQQRVDSQRQIVMITDGLIGFERAVVRALKDGLPKTARFHVVGVGSAVNRSLVAPIARAGRGVEAICGIGEDVERIADRVLRRTLSPLVVDVTIEGSALAKPAQLRMADLFAGAPLRAPLALRPEGGELIVCGRGTDGPFERRLRVPAAGHDAGRASLARLVGRDWIEELELAISAGDAGPPLDQEIERIALQFGIASRLTSFVAVTEERTVDPLAAYRKVHQTHQLPHGMNAEGLGLRVKSSSFAASSGAPGFAPMAQSFGELGRAAPPPMAAPAAMRPPPGMGGPPPPPSAAAPAGPPRARAMKLEAPLEPKSKSIARRISDGLRSLVEGKGGGREDSAADEEVMETSPEAASKKTRAQVGRTLTLRVLMFADNRILFELLVGEAGFELDLEDAQVTLHTKDGSAHLSRVVMDGSAAAASYSPGVCLRLTIESLGLERESIRRVVVTTKDGVELEAVI